MFTAKANCLACCVTRRIFVLDAAEAFGRTRPTSLNVEFAVARRCGRHEIAQELFRRQRDCVDRTIEGRLVRGRRLRHPADLVHVLQSSSADLVLVRRRLVVVEDPDVSAHAFSLIS